MTTGYVIASAKTHQSRSDSTAAMEFWRTRVFISRTHILESNRSYYPMVTCLKESGFGLHRRIYKNVDVPRSARKRETSVSGIEEGINPLNCEPLGLSDGDLP